MEVFWWCDTLLFHDIYDWEFLYLVGRSSSKLSEKLIYLMNYVQSYQAYSVWTTDVNKITINTCSGQNQPDYLGAIFLVKAKAGKHLNEKCSTEH